MKKKQLKIAISVILWCLLSVAPTRAEHFYLTNGQVLFLLDVWGLSTAYNDRLIDKERSMVALHVLLSEHYSSTDRVALKKAYSQLARFSNPFIGDSLTQLHIIPETLNQANLSRTDLRTMIGNDRFTALDVGSGNSMGSSLIFQFALANAYAGVSDGLTGRMYSIELVKALHESASKIRRHRVDDIKALLPDNIAAFQNVRVLGDIAIQDTLNVDPLGQDAINYGLAISSITRHLEPDELFDTISRLLAKTAPGGLWIINPPIDKSSKALPYNVRSRHLKELMRAAAQQSTTVSVIEIGTVLDDRYIGSQHILPDLRSRDPRGRFSLRDHLEQTDGTSVKLLLKKSRAR